jgi:hypothetical protein
MRRFRYARSEERGARSEERGARSEERGARRKFRMTPRLATCARDENLSQEPLPRRAWWQDVLSVPARPDLAEPASTTAPEGGFAHEKWWLEEAVERATSSD